MPLADLPTVISWVTRADHSISAAITKDTALPAIRKMKESFEPCWIAAAATSAPTLKPMLRTARILAKVSTRSSDDTAAPTTAWLTGEAVMIGKAMFV